MSDIKDRIVERFVNRFRKLREANTEMLRQSKEGRKELTSRKLPDRQSFAVNQYSGSHYDVVNKNLRKPSKDKIKSSHASNVASGVKSAMRPTQSDMNVYRGVKSSKHVGDAKAFSSTSLSPETARSFAGEKGHVMKLRVKKGTPVAYGDVSSEKEVILPPGKIGINKKSKSGSYTYHHGTYEPENK